MSKRRKKKRPATVLCFSVWHPDSWPSTDSHDEDAAREYLDENGLIYDAFMANKETMESPLIRVMIAKGAWPPFAAKALRKVANLLDVHSNRLMKWDHDDCVCIFDKSGEMH